MEIITNKLSTSYLTAEQVRVNNKSIDDFLIQEIKKVSSVIYKFRGSVDTYADLPKKHENGDVYNVIDTDINYAWDEKKNRWDPLGSSISIEGLSSQLSDVFQPKGDYITKGEISLSALSSDVKNALSNSFQPKGNYVLQSTKINGKELTSDITLSTSQIINDSGYLTSHQSISDISSGIGLSEYALSSSVPLSTSQLINNSGFISSLCGYATEEWVNNKLSDSYDMSIISSGIGLSSYAKKDSIPLSVSQLCNDSGFLTEHQSMSDISSGIGLSEYALKDEVPSEETLSDTFQLKGDYATKNEVAISSLSSGMKEALNDSFQPVGEYVLQSTKINGKELTSDISIDIPLSTSQLINNSGFLTAHLSMSDISTGIGLSEYATKSEVAVSALSSEMKDALSDTFQHKGDYVTQSTKINGQELTSDITISVPLSTSELINDSGFISSLCGYATEEWVKSKLSDSYELSTISSELGLSNYALISSVPLSVSQLCNDSGYLKEHQSMSDISTGIGLSDYALKTEVPSEETLSDTFQLKGDYATKNDVAISAISSEMKDALNDTFQPIGDYVLQSRKINDKELTSDISISVPLSTSELVNDSGFLTSHQSMSDISTGIGLSEYALKTDTAVSSISSDIKDALSDSFQTKGSYVLQSTKINGQELTSDIDIDVPLSTSELINDSGFISSLCGYATEEWVESKLSDSYDMSAISTGIGLSGYALTSSVPLSVSQLCNDSGFLTEHQSMSDISTGIGLSDYALKSEVPTEKTLSDTFQLKGDYASKEDVAISALSSGMKDALDGTFQPVGSYVLQSTKINGKELTSDITVDVPLSTSQLCNDSGFLTEHQSMSDISNGIGLSEYALSSSVPLSISQLCNDSGYLTEHQSMSDISTGIGLSEYATKSEVAISAISSEMKDALNDTFQPIGSYVLQSTKINGQELTSDITVDIPLSTSQLCNDSGFLKEHQSMDEISVGIDLSSYALKSEVPTEETLSDTFQLKGDYLSSDISTSFVLHTEELSSINDNEISNYVKKDDISEISTKYNSTGVTDLFSTLSSYSVGDYVTYNGDLFKCIVSCAAGTEFSETNFTKTQLLDDDAQLVIDDETGELKLKDSLGSVIWDSRTASMFEADYESQTSAQYGVVNYLPIDSTTPTQLSLSFPEIDYDRLAEFRFDVSASDTLTDNVQLIPDSSDKYSFICDSGITELSNLLTVKNNDLFRLTFKGSAFMIDNKPTYIIERTNYHQIITNE